MAKNRIAPVAYAPDTAIPPGNTIRDMLVDMGMTQAELAVRMKRPPNKINEIIRGKRQITVETALDLELTLGLPADFWLNLEKNYQLAKARISETERQSEEAAELKKFPIREMIKLGWLRKQPDVRSQVRELLAFFGIARFSQLQSVHSLGPAWRKSQHRQPCSYALAAWLRRGTLEASKIATATFNAASLTKSVAAIKEMTTQDEFEADLVCLCAKHGVAVVFVPHLPKSYVNGAAYWLNEKAVIQLSLRYRWADVIWFNFFHELGHILLHRSKRKAFLDDSFKDDGSFAQDDPGMEAEANQFASSTLIPDADFKKLLTMEFKRPAVIKSFANRLKISPGIVVGRLHHEKKLHPSMLNDLRLQMCWDHEVADC